MTPDTEGLHPIANTDRADRVADIVFVHGLGGSSHTTWRHGREGQEGHFFWPAELANELPQCAVWAVGYEAGIVPWFGADGLPIEDRAVNLAHKLTTGGLGERPLIFITVRVVRGGSWNNQAQNCRAAIRNRNEPANRRNNLGLRLSAAHPHHGSSRAADPVSGAARASRTAGYTASGGW